MVNSERQPPAPHLRAVLRGEGNESHALASVTSPQRLCVAAQQGQTQIVEALLAAGADKEATMKNGDTPLSIALRFGYDAIAALLQTTAPPLQAAVATMADINDTPTAEHQIEAAIAQLEADVKLMLGPKNRKARKKAKKRLGKLRNKLQAHRFKADPLAAGGDVAAAAPVPPAAAPAAEEQKAQASARWQRR